MLPNLWLITSELCLYSADNLHYPFKNNMISRLPRNHPQ